MSSLIRWDPFAEMDEVFGRLPTLRPMMDMQHGFVPALDVYEDADSVYVKIPLAGVDPHEVQVSVEKGVLTVQGASKKEHEVDEKNYYRKEVRSGSFYRQVALPVPVKEDRVSAEFENGMLRIIAPKAAPSQAKKVNVKVIKKNEEKK